MTETLVTCDFCEQEVPANEAVILPSGHATICLDCLAKSGEENPAEQE